MAAQTPRTPTAIKSVETLGTTRHEQASAMLSSILLLLGVVTTCMVLAWLSTTVVWNRPKTPSPVVDVGGGFNGDSPEGGEKELDVPGPEEARDLLVEEEQGYHAFESITSMVSTQALTWDEEGDDSVRRKKKGTIGIGTSDGIPAWERWEIKFTARNIEVYAQQLDFFKVELGVVGGGSDVIDYCSNLSDAKPTRRVGTAKNERRLFFVFKAGALLEADRTLARKAGIQVSDRVVFQFYTPEMYKQLLTLENLRMGKRRISEVKKTTFGLRGTSGQWEFYVLGQQYRGPLPLKS
ncbi:MAG: hypothetical protein IAF94_05000 [Pirellulaceae bacterium]|nr:hypothetical protein [Pirellulaceae bacterium]